MTRQILLLAIIAVSISSCTTAYKTGQTPDDVYYSPARPQAEYVEVDKDEYKDTRYNDEYYDDRYLRMKVRNRSRWDDLNDWYYYDRYSYTYNYHYGTWYNPYNSWNYYNNPYCHCYNNVIIVNPKGSQTQTAIVRPRSFNLSSYSNNNISNTNSTRGIKSSRPVTGKPVFNNSNSNTGRNQNGVSNVIRKIFTPGSIDNSNNSSNSNSSPSRTYTPSNSSSNNNSSSGSSNSSGSSGGGVSRPTRGGN